MGKKSRRFINKNDPSTLTFNLVSASHDDPRLKAAAASNHADGDSDDEIAHTVVKGEQQQVCNTLQRFIPKNAARKGKFSERLPDELLQVLEPEHFGIHENLPEEHIRGLCKEIYGVDEIPEELRKKIEYAAATISTERSTVERKDVAVDDTKLETSDCYFPIDGYDYEKHLRPIQQGGHFIAVKKTEQEREQQDEFSLKNKDLTAEEKEVLEAIEAAEAYETLSDDFMQAVGGETMLDGKTAASRAAELDLLWGGFVPQLPERRSSAERREIDALLAATRELDLDESGEEEYDEDDDEVEDVVGATDRVKEKDLDAILAEEYNEHEIGELDEDDEELLEGACEAIEDFDNLLDEFIADKKKQFVHPVNPNNENSDDQELYSKEVVDDEDIEIGPLSKEATLRVLELAKNYLEDEESHQDDEADWAVLEESHRARQQWDCETILSTRSNLYNHPGRIGRPKMNSSGSSVAGGSTKLTTSSLNAILHAKTVKSVLQAANVNKPQQEGQHLDQVVEESDDDASTTEDEDEAVLDLPEVITKRPKDETKEERKARKTAAKEARRIIRQCKKENAAVVKDAARKQSKISQAKNPFDIHDGVRRFRL